MVRTGSMLTMGSALYASHWWLRVSKVRLCLIKSSNRLLFHGRRANSAEDKSNNVRGWHTGSRALYRASARHACNKNEPGGVFSSPKLKKFGYVFSKNFRLKFFSHRQFQPDLKQTWLEILAYLIATELQYGRRAFSANLKKCSLCSTKQNVK